jgi:flagellar assembly protein FliH
VARSRRIPARRSQAYARWSLPPVGNGGTRVLKAEAPRATRRSAEAAAQAEVVPRESLEAQLVDNIRAGRFAAGISAGQLESIVRDAAREGREEGYREGFARGEREGLEQGRAEGIAAGRLIIEDAAARLARLLAALQQPLAGQQQELADAMLELVTRIARGVIRTELALQPDSIRGVVREALAALPVGAADVRVRVAPQDLALLGEFGAPGQGWSLEADPALESGDCRIESRESVVDYAVSGRFEQLVAQLLGAHAPPRERG